MSRIMVNNMEEVANFINGEWVIKTECVGNELIFNCPIGCPITTPADTVIDARNGIKIARNALGGEELEKTETQTIKSDKT